MPQAVAPAIIAGVAQLGGAYLQHRSNNNANKANQRATDQAMALERERDRAKSERYRADMQRYEKEYATWEEINRQIYARHGINLPAAQKQTQLSSGSGRGPTTYSGPGGPVAKPLSLGSLMGSSHVGPFDSQSQSMGPMAPPEGVQPANPSAQSLGDMAGWSDWRKQDYAAR